MPTEGTIKKNFLNKNTEQTFDKNAGDNRGGEYSGGKNVPTPKIDRAGGYQVPVGSGQSQGEGKAFPGDAEGSFAPKNIKNMETCEEKVAGYRKGKESGY